MKTKFMKKIFLLSVLTLGFGISRQAYADYSDAFKNGIMQELLNITSSSQGNSYGKSSLTFAQDGSTDGLETLVASYPKSQHKEVRASLKQLYEAFPQVARSVGIPTNDLSSAVAAVIAGAYMAYNNISLNDDYVKPMANQFKAHLENSRFFDGMSNREKKSMYDQMVMVGMTLAVGQSLNQSNPNSQTTAQLREAGKQILETILKVDASRVRITSQGISY